MKRHWLPYLLLGIGVYLLTLLAIFPAAEAYHLAAPRLLPASPLHLYDISGSVWSGRAGTVAYDAHSLGALSWHLEPLPLLLGHLALRCELDLPDGTVAGTAVISHSGMKLHHLSGRLPAATLTALDTALPFGTGGTLAFNIAQTDLPTHGAPSASGTVVWNDAALLANRPIPFGDLKLSLRPRRHGGIDGTVSDAGGPLQVNGSASLDAARAYHLDLRLRPRPNAGTALDNLLHMLGRPDPRGDYTLRYNGRY